MNNIAEEIKLLKEEHHLYKNGESDTVSFIDNVEIKILKLQGSSWRATVEVNGFSLSENMDFNGIEDLLIYLDKCNNILKK